MDKEILKEKAKKNWWAALPGVGVFVYPFVTKRKGKDFVKGYWPHIAYVIPGIIWKAPLVGALFIGPNYCSKDNSCELIKSSGLEEVIDSSNVYSKNDSNNYYFDFRKENYENN